MVDLAVGWVDQIARAGPWRPPSCPTLVVAPHPDDESLSTGGLTAHLRARGVPVTVLAVTDGGAAYPGVVGADRLVVLRRREQASALRELGVDAAATIRVGMSDGAVAAAEAELGAIIDRVIVERGIRHVVAPWTRDHHADHEVCGRASAAAAVRAGITITYGLFWALHRTASPSFGFGRLAYLTLDADERAAKRAAIHHHRSQLSDVVSVTPMLAAPQLAPTTLPFELFVVNDPSRR